MITIKSTLVRLVSEENGAETVEYALVAAILGSALVGIYTTLGADIKTLVSKIDSTVNATTY